MACIMSSFMFSIGLFSKWDEANLLPSPPVKQHCTHRCKPECLFVSGLWERWGWFACWGCSALLRLSWRVVSLLCMHTHNSDTAWSCVVSSDPLYFLLSRSSVTQQKQTQPQHPQGISPFFIGALLCQAMPTCQCGRVLCCKEWVGVEQWGIISWGYPEPPVWACVASFPLPHPCLSGQACWAVPGAQPTVC